MHLLQTLNILRSHQHLSFWLAIERREVTAIGEPSERTDGVKLRLSRGRHSDGFRELSKQLKSLRFGSLTQEPEPNNTGLEPREQAVLGLFQQWEKGVPVRPQNRLSLALF